MHNFIKGCMFIEKKGKSPFQYSFQHEVMYVGNSNNFSNEDKIYLTTLGFEVDEDLECFYTFT